jgi:hypothetical protein
MRRRLADPRSRHHAVAALILLAGLAAAVTIYVRATVAPDRLPELSADTSKTYLRDLQRYGGTANVLATELRGWFIGLWQGRRLAFTVAALALLTSLAYLFFTVVFAPYWEAAGPEQRARNQERGAARDE